jgi:hypothetical protein
VARYTRLHLLARRFEGDPRAQYAWHKWASRFWAANVPAVIAVFTFAPAVWAKVSVLYLVLVSLYANWATNFSGMSSAEGAAEGPVSAFSVEAEAEITTGT